MMTNQFGIHRDCRHGVVAVDSESEHRCRTSNSVYRSDKLGVGVAGAYIEGTGVCIQCAWVCIQRAGVYIQGTGVYIQGAGVYILDVCFFLYKAWGLIYKAHHAVGREATKTASIT